ncbi:Phosphatidylinositol-specific phospholipase C domain-containing protein [Mycena venus]|uniref:Phosphatidylinositol-specific phospholipase C domain-containing protein n=1 Tax=Mycena venus TaxID=2733690 RepID=A0A8H6XL90_9AGAR|nr:Phosphatidylinositol-specific phospholipase C domain-containing protein [Mycena venus]
MPGSIKCPSCNGCGYALASTLLRCRPQVCSLACPLAIPHARDTTNTHTPPVANRAPASLPTMPALSLVPLLVRMILAGPVLLRADDSYLTLSMASNPGWMLKVPDGTSLASIPIPGTYEFVAIFGGDLAECQETFGASDTLTAQLNAGMFDTHLRIKTDHRFTLHHGAVYQNANFDDLLNRSTRSSLSIRLKAS